MTQYEIKQHDATRIAVPYYGTLIRPGRGFERLYFVADVGVGNEPPRNYSVKVWNRKEFPDLASWATSQGVRGILCSDRYPEFENKLRASGVWACWEQEGDLSEMLSRWASAQAA